MRKISSGVARIKMGLATEVRLGNLDARRDWGHSADYVRAMRLIQFWETTTDNNQSERREFLAEASICLLS
jgi:GDPmannose 4,6-dehydratase